MSTNMQVTAVRCKKYQKFYKQILYLDCNYIFHNDR